MPKKITIVVFSEHKVRIQSLSISVNRIKGVLGILAAVFAGMTAIFFDYGNLNEALRYSPLSRRNLSLQQEEIVRQRRQIQFFASEINKLKSSLLAFNQFESKIRIISNIEAGPDATSLFGIGGPMPEDLDVNLPVTQSHDALLREMHTQLQQVDTATLTQHQGFKSLLDYLEDQRSLLSSTPSIRPARGWTSSGFGQRQSPFTGLPEFHKGIDIAAADGETVVAPGDGLVTFANQKGTMGRMIIIDHGHGIITRFGHLKTFSKKQGDFVKRGECIGFIGLSGRTTGPHLHYEVLLNGIPVKPTAYILE